MGHDLPQLAEGWEEKQRCCWWKKGWVSLKGSHDVTFLIRGFAQNRTDGTARPSREGFNFLTVFILLNYEHISINRQFIERIQSFSILSPFIISSPHPVPLGHVGLDGNNVEVKAVRIKRGCLRSVPTSCPPPPPPMHPDPLKVVDNQEPWRVVPGRWVRMDKTGSQETS